MFDMSIKELEAEMAVVLPDREVMHHGARFTRNNFVSTGDINQLAIAANVHSEDSTAVATNAVIILQNSGHV